MQRRAFVVLSVLALAGCSKLSKSEEEPLDYPIAPELKATGPHIDGPMVPELNAKGQARTKFDSPIPTDAQLARKARSKAVIAKMTLPWLDSLPVVEDEKTIEPRTTEDVSSRCIATEICAVKGESKDNKIPLDLVEKFGAKGFLSPKEAAFLRSSTPREQDFIDFAWRYEGVHVFLWALGYLPKLNPPNQLADVKKEAAILRNLGPKRFIKEAKLRPLGEILDQADLYYRIHWAVLELRLKNQKNPIANEEIVDERHRALNWLIRYMNQDWDDVTTDT